MKFGLKRQKSTNNEKQPFLAIDIGTDSVKTVVYLIEDREVVVVGYDRTTQSEDAMYGAYIVNLTEVIDAVDRSIGKSMGMAEELLQTRLATPKKVILGIAGELVHGATIVVNVDREKPDEEISLDEVSNLIEKVKKHSFLSIREEIAEELGVSQDLLEEINTEVNSVYIDGVRVTNPLKFKGSEISYRVFSTFAPKVHIDSIKQVAKELGLKDYQIIVEPYALSLALKDIRQNNSSAIFLDIGGGTTDVALVQNGDIIGTKMFAIGGRVFTKRIQKDLNLDYQEAETRKLNYTDGKLLSNQQMEVGKAISKDIPVWLEGVQLALESFEDLEEYPAEIYICGGGALMPEIQEGIISHPWLKVLKFGKFPKVNFFFPSSVRQVKDKTKQAKLPVDVTPLALARMSLDLY